MAEIQYDTSPAPIKSAVKSIQRGYVSDVGAVTISAVNPDKSVLIFSYMGSILNEWKGGSESGYGLGCSPVSGKLTNSIRIDFSHKSTSYYNNGTIYDVSPSEAKIEWQVIEYV